MVLGMTPWIVRYDKCYNRIRVKASAEEFKYSSAELGGVRLII